MSKEPFQKIVELLRSGELATRYGGLVAVQEHPAGGLVLLNYTEECQYQRAWDEVTSWCRGLIIDTNSWGIAALPFPKFFNLGERPEISQEALPREPFVVYEKLDGSLGISYRRGEKVALATRGSFTSREARRGTAFLHRLKNVEAMPTSWTFLFEVICQDQRCVSRYDFEGLALLTVFNRGTGRELNRSEVQAWADRLGCRTPKVYPFGTLVEVVESRAKLPAHLEGYVIRFASGFRVKVKGDAYLALHRLVAGLTEERVLQEQCEGTGERFLRQVPEEFRAEIEQVMGGLQRRAEALETQALEWFEKAPKGEGRKRFAQWVQAQVPAHLRAALFQLLDNQASNWYRNLKIAQTCGEEC